MYKYEKKQSLGEHMKFFIFLLILKTSFSFASTSCPEGKVSVDLENYSINELRHMADEGFLSIILTKDIKLPSPSGKDGYSTRKGNLKFYISQNIDLRDPN